MQTTPYDTTQTLLASLSENLTDLLTTASKTGTARGMAFNAARGLYNGYPILGYRGEPGKPYEIDPDTAPIVRYIYRTYADGMPMMRLCADLAEQGILSSRQRPFTVTALRRILSNRAYIGEYRWRDSVLPDGMPRIIDDDLFNTVQQRLEDNRLGGKRAHQRSESNPIQDFWLTNRMHCGLCGQMMQGVTATGKTKKHHYYSCKGHRKHTCSMKNKPKAIVEQTVLDLLSQVTDADVHDPLVRTQLLNESVESIVLFEDRIDIKLHGTNEWQQLPLPDRL